MTIESAFRGPVVPVVPVAPAVPDPAVQARGPAPAPIGVVYNTSMSRPDAALALAAMYANATRGALRVCAVCVTGAGLETAIFCDVVNRFYVPGARSSNTALPIGLAAVSPMPADSPMVKAAAERKTSSGEPQYIRSIKTLTDTSQAEAVLRNGVTFSPQSVMVLSAPPTFLAKSLDLLGAKDLYQARVKRLVIVEAGVRGQDAAAFRKLIGEWPAPIVYCPRTLGEQLPFLGANLDVMFGWAPAHPVVDAYRAYKPMPYDAPLHDLAAMHYAVKPDAGLFSLSDPGTLSIANDGTIAFTAGAGNVRRLTLDAAKRAETLDALVAMAATQPPPPAQRGRGGD
jgi:hypothetical protein